MKKSLDVPRGKPRSVTKENTFFLNDKGVYQYNKVCEQCSNNCKLSFRTDIISCVGFEKK